MLANSSVLKDKPLYGKRILITRSRKQAAAFADQVEQLGGEAITCPVIDMVPISDQEGLMAIQDALSALTTYDWVVFTSRNGVDHFIKVLEKNELHSFALHHVKVAAVGPKTAAQLERNGIMVKEVPERYDAESLTDWLTRRCHPGERILLARGNLARSYLPDKLIEHGLKVTDLVVYNTVMPDREHSEELFKKLMQDRIDWITFTSSSTVDNLIQLLSSHTDNPVSLINQSAVACIGPITAATAKKKGIFVNRTALTYTTEALLQELVKGGN